MNFARRAKYGNKKTKCSHGHLHDSKKEAARCDELHLMQRLGAISALETQRRVLLIPKQKGERACEYVADFAYFRDGKKILEDVKSDATRKNPEYVMKRKLAKALCVNRVALAASDFFDEFLET